MRNQFTNDQEILEALRSGDFRQREAAVKHLYTEPKFFAAAKKQIVNYHGTEEDANDMFAEALVTFLNQLDIYDVHQSSVSTYIANIAKNKYCTLRRGQERRENREKIFNYLQMGEAPSPEIEMLRAEKRELLDKAMAKMGEKCHKLLTFFQLGHKNEEIAIEMGYKNANVAKTELQTCKDKLRLHMTQRPDIADELNKQL